MVKPHHKYLLKRIILLAIIQKNKLEQTNNIKKASNIIKNDIKILKKEAQVIKNNSKKYYMSSKNNILSRKEIYDNINKTYDNIQKELRYISNENYKIKKDIRKNRNDIGDTKKYIRYNQYRLKITNKPDLFKNVLNQIIKKVYTIKFKLHIAKNELEKYKKDLHADKSIIIQINHDIYDIEIGLYNTKKKFKMIIKVVVATTDEYKSRKKAHSKK